MKQDKNNEMDLLLRSLARRGRSSLVPGMSMREGGHFSDHLDADELNSFAEGVVPAPARARYISHLADCESCRGAVITLTQASGAAAARSETRERQTGAGFWHNLASLFSPPVLRYAVPALALTAVIAISFVALRQQRRPDLLAQNEHINSAATTRADRQQTESPVAQPIEVQSKARSAAESPLVVDSSKEKKTSQDEVGSVAKAPAATTDTNAPLSSTLKDSAPSNQSYSTARSRPVFAAEPQAAPPPPKPGLNEGDKSDAFKKEEVAKRELQTPAREQEKNQPRDEAGRHGPSRSNTVVTGNRQADGLMTERAEAKAKSRRDSDDARKANDEGETRTVSGKRFRRQGNAWIDTAYDSSRGTTNVSRGSEQFRALVADEPGIRTIAEKLNGLIIVVWNGRAYRIQ